MPSDLTKTENHRCILSIDNCTGVPNAHTSNTQNSRSNHECVIGGTDAVFGRQISGFIELCIGGEGIPIDTRNSEVANDDTSRGVFDFGRTRFNV